MDTPIMLDPYRAANDTDILPAYLPVPGLGVLPVNAFLIRAEQPVLVDTGMGPVRDEFMARLRTRIAPEDIRWIWLTHTDPDHVGSFARLLEEAPNARVVTTYLGMGKLGLLNLPVPPERVYLLNPGQTLDVGDRRLLAVKPPCYDAPETTGMFDPSTRALFTADCFGSLLKEPVEAASDIAPSELRDGLVTWTTVDAPWLASLRDGSLGEALGAFSRLEPSVILSGHLPPARHMTEVLSAHLVSAQSAPAFVGPDQAALEQMLAGAGS